MIEREVMRFGWMGGAEFREIVSLSGMAPGPIATNSATLIGYHSAGLAGAIAATAGMILPSLILIIVISAFFHRIHTNFWVRSSFYGLKPAITGLILYAGLHFGFPDGTGVALTWPTAATLMICAGCIYGVMVQKMHPFFGYRRFGTRRHNLVLTLREKAKRRRRCVL